MNEHLRPSGREVRTDQAVAHDLVGVKFVNHQFERLVASKKTFTVCDFSFSEFDAAYLRNCTFDSCNFTGCKFTNTNLRGSDFIGCKFDYAQFSHTHVEPDILDTGCPSCRIPDDYISVSRLPLFSAREVLRGLVEDLKTCCPGELPA